MGPILGMVASRRLASFVLCHSTKLHAETRVPALFESLARLPCNNLAESAQVKPLARMAQLGCSGRLGVSTRSLYKWIKLLGDPEPMKPGVDHEAENRRLSRFHWVDTATE